MIKEIIAFAGGYRLKNLKSMEGRDGYVWSGTLYKDGRKLGQVGNGGYGGPDDLDLSAGDLKTLEDYAKTKVDPEFETAGTFVSALADYTESIKRFKRLGNTSIVVIQEGELDDYGVPSSVTRFKVAPTPKNVAAVKAKYPTYRLLIDEIGLWS